MGRGGVCAFVFPSRFALPAGDQADSPGPWFLRGGI